MNKSLLTLSYAMLLAGVSTIEAKSVWFLNLSNSTQSFTYLKEQFVGKDWSRESFKNVSPRSVTNRHDVGLRRVCFNFAGWSCLPLSARLGDYTVIKRANGKTETVNARYDNKKVLEIIKKDLGNKSPKELIKNW